VCVDVGHKFNFLEVLILIIVLFNAHYIFMSCLRLVLILYVYVYTCGGWWVGWEGGGGLVYFSFYV
jgi:hypothetical protein